MGGQKFKRSKIEEGENYITKGSKGINPVTGKISEKRVQKKSNYYIYKKKENWMQS